MNKEPLTPIALVVDYESIPRAAATLRALGVNPDARYQLYRQDVYRIYTTPTTARLRNRMPVLRYAETLSELRAVVMGAYAEMQENNWSSRAQWQVCVSHPVAASVVRKALLDAGRSYRKHQKELSALCD